jgi:hypothetical protein
MSRFSSELGKMRVFMMKESGLTELWRVNCEAIGVSSNCTNGRCLQESS